MKEGREGMDEGGPERASVGSRGNRGKKRDAWGARAKKILNQRKFEEEKNTRKMVENRSEKRTQATGGWNGDTPEKPERGRDGNRLGSLG
jgi:hypothetical protein